MTTAHNTIAACLAWGKDHYDEEIRWDAGRLAKLCEWRRLARADLEKMPAGIHPYLAEIAPRFDKKNARLVRDLDGAFKIDTYQQYQRSGRRLIDLFTGEAEATAERKARNDGWSVLIALLEDLSEAGLVLKKQILLLATIADIARRSGLLPRDLAPDHLHALRAAIRHSSDWDKVLRALRFLDSVRVHAVLLDHLPKLPFGRIDTTWRRVFIIPQTVSDAIDAWISPASREKVNDARFAHMAAPLSDDYRARLTSALRNYAYTAEEAGKVCLAQIIDLSELFEPAVVDATIGRWLETSSKPGGLCLTSIADYCSDLIVILSRNGLPDPASYIGGLCDVHRDIRTGRIMGRKMSRKNQSWCRDLLTNQEKIAIFDTQHVLYWEQAQEVLAEAKAAGLNLRDLIASETLEKLPRKRRALAKKLLSRARRFGTCAAFAAIEIEGAPFRKSNTLDLSREGPGATFFDHLNDPDPRFTIIIPNEQLKNGKALTSRSEELPPIDIREVSPADHGVAILRWFINDIRPLFPGWKRTNHLFPPCSGKQSRLNTRTFDAWLFACSTAIGLPLTPHNFRHAYVSIQYAVDRSCLGDLAIILGDEESPLRRHYRFIDLARTAREIQESVRRRRETRREAWRPVPMRRAA